MSSVRIFSLALLFALSGNIAQSQDPARHSVVPLHVMSPGQWVEKVWGDFTKPGEPFVFRVWEILCGMNNSRSTCPRLC
jgi:hypothetical protein